MLRVSLSLCIVLTASNNAFGQFSSGVLSGIRGASVAGGAKSRRIPIHIATTGGAKAILEAITGLEKAREKVKSIADQKKIDVAVSALKVVLSKEPDPSRSQVISALANRTNVEITKMLGDPDAKAFAGGVIVWGYNYGVQDPGSTRDNSVYIGFNPMTRKCVGILFSEGRVKAAK
jgi:hypothetical protein